MQDVNDEGLWLLYMMGFAVIGLVIFNLITWPLILWRKYRGRKC